MILVLAGCVGKLPFINEPPKLLTVNGIGADKYRTVFLDAAEPGSVLELDVVAKDPEGDDFGIWFPAFRGTIDFDPYGSSGSILLPERGQTGVILLQLRDERDPIVGASYHLYLGSGGGSTYSYYTYGSYEDSGSDTGSY